MKRLCLFLVSLVVLFPSTIFARTSVDYWYVKGFKTEITVNTDSSIDVTEDIVADCGSAEKHGIYRILPTFQQLSTGEKIQSPITLASISDFSGNPYHYSTTKSSSDGTITWKIGDSNVYVTGVNDYRIKYHVKNAVRHNSENFDEFYWNLSGNFWDLDIDNFQATITFPQSINSNSGETNIYSGSFGEKNSLDATQNWLDGNRLQVTLNQTMTPGEGITASVTFPKGIINPYVPTFWEKYGKDFFLLIPLLVLILMYLLWNKIGRDPTINPTIAPEFEIPEKLSPIDMGLVLTDGQLKNHFVSASIINLAVKGYLKIDKIGKKDFKLTKLSSSAEVSESEKNLFSSLFNSKDQVQISDLKNKFYTNLPKISLSGNDFLISKGWLIKNSRLWQYLFLGLAILIFFLSFGSFAISSMFGLALILTSIIIFIFSFILPRRSKDGAVLLRRVKGFKLYMNTAEKYRSRFNEKENIFEKFLPYAIMFQMTKEWIKKMKDIYGEQYFDRYHPVWFYGAAVTDFNIDSLASEISAMSTNMASTISSSPSSSGSGGGGFSGGGGGGGGGGGW